MQDVQSAIHRLLIPAKRPQIAAHIARLANHYHATPRGDAAAQCYAEDWLDDLSHLPDDIIEAACVKWRRDDNKFMCSPGELLKYANEILRYRRFYADRAESVLQDRPEPTVENVLDTSLCKSDKVAKDFSNLAKALRAH